MKDNLILLSGKLYVRKVYNYWKFSYIYSCDMKFFAYVQSEETITRQFHSRWTEKFPSSTQWRTKVHKRCGTFCIGLHSPRVNTKKRRKARRRLLGFSKNKRGVAYRKKRRYVRGSAHIARVSKFPYSELFRTMKKKTHFRRGVKKGSAVCL